MLDRLIRLGTPASAVLFIVSAVSGVALFLHVQPGWFHGVHEWLSMVLLIPFVFHLIRNWKPFVAYFQRGQMLWPSAIALVASLAFIIPGAMSTRGRPDPLVPLAQSMEAKTVSATAAFFGQDETALEKRLATAGFTLPGADPTLGEIAKASGRPSRDIVALLARP